MTGTLTPGGSVGFNGIILVPGDGVFQRNGGGNWGHFRRHRGREVLPGAGRLENGQLHSSLSPTYDMNGGGNSTTGYDSNEVNHTLAAPGLCNMGVREY